MGAITTCISYDHIALAKRLAIACASGAMKISEVKARLARMTDISITQRRAILTYVEHYIGMKKLMSCNMPMGRSYR